jgi:hypothetical protein
MASTKAKLTWKIAISVTVAILAAMAFMVIYPNYHDYKEYKIHSDGLNDLKKLIEAEDAYFQANGKFLAVDSSVDTDKVKRLLNWRSSKSSPCEYSVMVSDRKFTIESKCPLEDGNFNYMGYVRAAPGSETGIDGAYGKCSAKGIYAGSRYLVNDVGPCTEQNKGILSVASGSMKRLVVETYPRDATVFANRVAIGKTSSQHNVLSQNYGSFFWEDPYNEPINIRVSKQGFKPVEFKLNWGSYTYTSTIVLEPDK